MKIKREPAKHVVKKCNKAQQEIRMYESDARNLSVKK
jgi:hypothetical protein